MKFAYAAAAASALAMTEPAFAQEEAEKASAITLSGSAALVSDYRFRGVSQTDEAHIGYSSGNAGLGPNATSVAPSGKYWDWSLGMDATWKNLTLGVSYVDTDISQADATYLRPSFSKGQDGTGSIADGAFVVALTASF